MVYFICILIKKYHISIFLSYCIIFSMKRPVFSYYIDKKHPTNINKKQNKLSDLIRIMSRLQLNIA
jgi:hypothetical protein